MEINKINSALKPKRILIVFVLFQLVLSMIFYQERTIFVDNALQTFLMINNQNITVMANRWPAAVIRILPFVGTCIGLSLKTILFLFSISYVLYHIVLAFLISKLLNNKFALLYISTYAILLGHSFFWCVSELLQAVAVSIFILGIVDKYKDQSFNKTAMVVLIGSLILVFYHPQSILCLLFGLLYFLKFEELRTKLLSLPMIALGVFFLKSIFYKNWYDTMKFNSLKNNVLSMWPEYWNSATNEAFGGWIFKDLILFSSSFLIVLLYLIYKKWIYKLFLFISFSFVFLFLFHTTNPGGMKDFYAEAGYLPLSLFISIPLIFDVLKDNRFRNIIISFMVVLCFTKILVVSSDYTERLIWVKAYVDEEDHSKTIVLEKTLPLDKLKMTWGLPFETLIISILKDPSRTKTIVTTKSKKQYEKFLSGKEIINGMGGVFPYNENQSYFHFPEGQYLFKE